MYYARNKAASRTINNGKTLTDQSAAKDTDRNVIVKKFMVHGQVPTGKTPIYGDFSEFPEDLAGFLRQAQSIGRLQEQLPKELRDLTLDALINLTADELANKLKKPEPPVKKPEPPVKKPEPPVQQKEETK